ncbi:hypothetical protein BD769DRAFT_1642263 [Suillus cothurnatus]|nr:hypothetical protein BD769DRAFT_1642263 [Suillus cothurnatus]
MTVVSNDPSWWPHISLSLFYSYWSVAAGVVVIYDWVLTLGQEIELIWIRYLGIPYSVMGALDAMTSISKTDAVSNIIYRVMNGTNVVMAAMLGVIMIARLHAMYQRSRMILIFLVIIFLAVNIACGVITAIALDYVVMGKLYLSTSRPQLIWQTLEELIVFSAHMCSYVFEGDVGLFASMIWMLNTVWEVLALGLSVWIAVKHFRDLRRFGPSTGLTIGDCFKVLIKSHVLYFASFFGASCLELVSLSPELLISQSIEAQILNGVIQIVLSVQMFVLGPRLILSVREYHAKLVAESDADISMSSIVFEERVHVPTSSTV